MTFGYQAGLSIVLHLIAFILTWWAIQGIKWELFFRKPKGKQALCFMVLFSLAISYLVSKFFLDYLGSSLLLMN
ncbi:DUF1146 family protein [Terrilactibacillus laevilacticus]|uniref:DUF1146 family protein n=1 Tax=Terrilactibacillus laevilacticus TaxID=1380157 RepID=A0ABW5PNF8_9BACI|nr:DUF1146 family protein [Terrilactibacillus laevilacticus]